MAGNETCTACDKDVLWLVDGGHWLLGGDAETNFGPKTSVAVRWYNFDQFCASIVIYIYIYTSI